MTSTETQTGWAGPKLVLAIIVSLVIIIGSLGFAVPATESFAAINNPVAALSNPVNVSLNVSFANVQWTSEPPQFNFTGSSLPSNEIMDNTTSWLLNNSGYQMLVQNSTASPSYGYLEFPVSSSLGSNVSYLMYGTRAAFNGSSTSYIVLAGAKQTAAPSSTLNAQSTSPTSAQEYLALEVSPVTGKSYFSLSALYYKEVTGGNGLKYINYTTTSFGTTYLAPLTFYTFQFYVGLNATTGLAAKNVTSISVISDANGTTAGSESVAPVLQEKMANLSYVEYSATPAASKSGALIANMGYLVDHSTYTSSSLPSAIAAPALAGTSSNVVSTQSNNVQNTTFGRGNNGTVSPVGNTNITLQDFQSVLNSSSAAMETSALLNNSDAVTGNITSGTLINSTSALDTMRTLNETYSGFTGTLYVSNFSSAGLHAAIMNFLKSYVSANYNVPQSYVSILSYVVQNIYVNSNFTSGAAKALRDQIYNNYAADLKSNGLSLVNTDTGAITAGALVGDFYHNGQGYVPIASSAGIIDPLTGVSYATLQAAGFPVGTYISAGAVIVPQISILGYHNGLPIYSGAFSFGGLSGAASAVQSFLTSAVNSVQNVPSYTSKAITANQVVKPLSTATSTAWQNFGQQLSSQDQSAMPIFGGTLANIATQVQSGFTNTLNAGKTSLASAESSAVGAIAAGKTDFTNEIYHIGAAANKTLDSVMAGVSAAGANETAKINAELNGLYNSAGHEVQAAQAVISPLFMTLKNLPLTLTNITDKAISAEETLYAVAKNQSLRLGQGAGNIMGLAYKDATNTSNPLAWAISLSTMGLIAGPLVLAGGAISTDASHFFNWVYSTGKTAGYTLIVVAAIAIVAILMIGLYIVWRRRQGKGSEGHSDGRERATPPLSSPMDAAFFSPASGLSFFAELKRRIELLFPIFAGKTHDRAEFQMPAGFSLFMGLFALVLVAELVFDLFLLPADVVLVPAEVVGDVVLISLGAYGAFRAFDSGGEKK